MVITPRKLGFICTTAHPLGCRANVADQIYATSQHLRATKGPRRVLVIGASSGYGLAARINAAFGYGAATIGVFMEKPAKGKRPASAGWYNSAAFEYFAQQRQLTSESINGDAFAQATMDATIEIARQKLGGNIDLVIYSLAAPTKLRADGNRIHAVIKPIGHAFKATSIDTDNACLTKVNIEAATQHEIDTTCEIMGGDPWLQWIKQLAQAKVLAPDAQTIAFSYAGPRITWPIYRDGTIGYAKSHLAQTANLLDEYMGRPCFARIAMLKSIPTQASAAIPVIPLYLSIVSRLLRKKGLDEHAIDQQNRLFGDVLYTHTPNIMNTFIRLDEHELDSHIQAQCQDIWQQITNQTIPSLTDFARYQRDFLQLFGFARSDIDYQQDVDPTVDFPCTIV